MMFVGEYLKQARTKSKIKLNSVSKELNISIGYLQAIENNEFSKTPGGVYTIGFIGSYANYLNLDSKAIIDEYKMQISSNDIPNPIELPKPIEFFHFFYYPKIASLLIFVAVSVSFYFFFIDQSNLQPDYAITSSVPEGLESKIEDYEIEMALSELKAINNKEILTNKEVAETAILTNLDSQTSAFATKQDANIDNIFDNLITLKALNSTWIQLRNSNNEILYSKLLNIDEEYSYSIKDNLIITTGNAGDIVVSIGGNVMGKLGKKGEVLDSISISPDYFSN